MHTRVISSINELRGLVGEEIGVSDWIPVRQSVITQFAEATLDMQWIHLDSKRAEKESPYKSTIAHGFLTLAFLPFLSRQVIEYSGDVRMTINYGLNRVRFPAAVRSGTRIRGRFRLLSTEEIDDGLQLVWAVTVEAKGSKKPCVVAEWVTRVCR